MNLSKQVWEHTFLKPFLQILSPSNCLLEYTVFILKNIIGFFLNDSPSPFIISSTKTKSRFMLWLTAEEILHG